MFRVKIYKYILLAAHVVTALFVCGIRGGGVTVIVIIMIPIPAIVLGWIKQRRKSL